MKKQWFILIVSIGLSFSTLAQVKIGDNLSTVSPGSILELESTNKALTLPRLTTVQMQAIPSPLSGMIVFNTDSNCIYLYKNNNLWSSISTSTTVVSNNNLAWPYQSNNLTVGTAGNGQGIISTSGSGLTASGVYSHAEGKYNVASGNYSWSSGYSDTATGLGSAVMGYQNKTTGTYSFSTGFKNIAGAQSSVVFGQENNDTGWSSMVMGLKNKIFSSVSYSNVLGYANEIRSGNSNNTLGESNIINSGTSNIALGYGNIVSGSYNQLFGKNNKILAGSGNIEGGDNNTIKSGLSNSLFGYNNTADGNYLTALGKENSVYYQSSVALGQLNKDSGYCSVAGGHSNIIEKSVQYSSSFGYNNVSTRNLSITGAAPGSATFSAGSSNFNSGYGSMVLGGFNRSTNFYSIAGNYNTISNGFSMSAFGHYNDTITSAQTTNFNPQEILFAIGNGTGNTNRRNSFTMMRNGFTTINTSAQNGSNVPRAELDIKGTGAIIVPVGTTAQRPVSPVEGMIRFCTDCPGGPVLQGFDGVNWINL